MFGSVFCFLMTFSVGWLVCWLVGIPGPVFRQYYLRDTIRGGGSHVPMAACFCHIGKVSQKLPGGPHQWLCNASDHRGDTEGNWVFKNWVFFWFCFLQKTDSVRSRFLYSLYFEQWQGGRWAQGGEREGGTHFIVKPLGRTNHYIVTI